MDASTLQQIAGKSIFLVGFMGSGKTHWGRQWAASLGRDFADLDTLVELTAGADVKTIFEKQGEDHFRELEAAALRSLPRDEKLLVSCGGGAPCFHDNMDWINDNGHSIYLKASPKFLLKNIVSEPQARPLLKNMNEAEMLFFIEKTLAERESFYNRAHTTVDAELLNLDLLSTLQAGPHA